MQIFGIHGAFSSPNSFNYLKTKLQEYKWTMFDYSNKINNIEGLIEDADEAITEPTFVIGHSLGGVIGTNLIHNQNVRGILTISSPLAGIKVNMFLYWILLQNTFINELIPTSKLIQNTNKIVYDHHKPIYSIITSKGISPYLFEPNDGVVTVRSQLIGNHPKMEISANHAEVMQLPETVDIIKQIYRSLS